MNPGADDKQALSPSCPRWGECVGPTVAPGGFRGLGAIVGEAFAYLVIIEPFLDPQELGLRRQMHQSLMIWAVHQGAAHVARSHVRWPNDVAGRMMNVEQATEPECFGRPGNLTVCHGTPR